MIARIDDTTQFLMENLTAHPDFDFTLQSKLTWSKMCTKSAPNQILIGAMDPGSVSCLHSAVAEVFIESGRGALTPYVFGFSDDYTVPKGGLKAKVTSHFLK
jgi:hypothetical protein